MSYEDGCPKATTHHEALSFRHQLLYIRTSFPLASGFSETEYNEMALFCFDEREKSSILFRAIYEPSLYRGGILIWMHLK